MLNGVIRSLAGEHLRCDADTSKCVCDYGFKTNGHRCEYCKYVFENVAIKCLAFKYNINRVIFGYNLRGVLKSYGIVTMTFETVVIVGRKTYFII